MREERAKINSLLEHEFNEIMGQKMESILAYDQERFDILMERFYDENWLINQRVSWFITPMVEKQPELLLPHLGKMIDGLDTARHPSYTRNVMRLMQHYPLPEEHEGKLFDHAAKLLIDIKEPAAGKVFGMTAMLRIARPYPELLKEMKMIIETQIPFEKPGFKSRGRKTLALIEKYLKEGS